MTEHTTLTPNVRINGRVSKQDHGKPELSSRVIGARVVCGEIDEFFYLLHRSTGAEGS
jgi:hypothetical protein